MKKNNLKRVRMLSGILLFLFFVFVPTGVGHAEGEVNVDLTLSPQTELFHVGNIKPGDSIIRIITVQNTGDVDFGYTSYARHVSGSEELYEGLELTIEDADEVLYDGKLSDFNLLEQRKLESGTEEGLTFTVTSPSSLGNDFQNLGVEFEVIFQATGQVVSPPGDDDEEPVTPPDDEEPVASPEEGEQVVIAPSDRELPDTATDNYNLMAIGLVIVLAGGGLYAFQRRKRHVK